MFFSQKCILTPNFHDFNDLCTFVTKFCRHNLRSFSVNFFRAEKPLPPSQLIRFLDIWCITITHFGLGFCVIALLYNRVSHQNMFFWNKKNPTQSRGIWVVGWRIPKGFLISTTFRGCTRLSKIWPLHRGQFIKCDSNAEVYLISETMTQASMAKSLR